MEGEGIGVRGLGNGSHIAMFDADLCMSSASPERCAVSTLEVRDPPAQLTYCTRSTMFVGLGEVRVAH